MKVTDPLDRISSGKLADKILKCFGVVEQTFNVRYI